MDKKEMANQFVETFNNANWRENRALMADNCTYTEYASGREVHSGDEWIAVSKAWKEAFPDAKGTIRSTIETGDRVIQEVTWSGTNTGPMTTPDGQQIPATNRFMETHAVWILEVQDDKVQKADHYFDMLTMLQQLGLTD